VEVFFRENTVDQPLDEQGIEQVHQATQYDQGHADRMRPEERSQLPRKPTELRVGIRRQGNS
jgi:hypothetical protein